MAINVSTSNYINTQTAGTNSGQAASANINVNTEGAIVSVKGLDLQAGMTLSGQVLEIDGKDIKLLLSNNQTINARLEGNINALLGQTISFEVKNSENGQTALRPLYTNLNNSQTVVSALQSAGLPVTDSYAKMVSSMMDESMPINKQALYDMSKNINSFPNSNPDTIVKLNKLGLQINELTINQYENYKGFEHKIVGDVSELSKGLTDLLKESLSDYVLEDDISLTLNGKESSADLNNQNSLNAGMKFDGKNLFSAFLNAITGAESKTGEDVPLNQVVSGSDADILEGKETNSALDQLSHENSTEVNSLTSKEIPVSAFDSAKSILDMIDTESISADDSLRVSGSLENFTKEIINIVKNEIVLSEENIDTISEQNSSKITGNTRESIISEILSKNNAADLQSSQDATVKHSFNESILKLSSNTNITENEILTLAKDILKQMENTPQKFSESLKSKFAQLISDKQFGDVVNKNITKQMLLRPEEVVNAKNIDELYMKIARQAANAAEILSNSGKENPELYNAARNISDNVSFMNELNQVVTYIQLPLMMNNKAAHGDLYVYTNKKSLKNNDGNISALLHLDMDNLGPMDIYVALNNGTKLNTHFYLKDDATIDFIEANIDRLNKRLTEKGYEMNVDVSVKDKSKGNTSMADEFLKDDPGQSSMNVSKFSFDVRA